MLEDKLIIDRCFELNIPGGALDYEKGDFLDQPVQRLTFQKSKKYKAEDSRKSVVSPGSGRREHRNFS